MPFFNRKPMPPSMKRVVTSPKPVLCKKNHKLTISLFLSYLTLYFITTSVSFTKHIHYHTTNLC